MNASSGTPVVGPRLRAGVTGTVLYGLGLVVFFSVIASDLPTAIETAVGLSIAAILSLYRFHHLRYPCDDPTSGQPTEPWTDRSLLVGYYCVVALGGALVAYLLRTSARQYPVVAVLIAYLAVGELVAIGRTRQWAFRGGLLAAGFAAVPVGVGLVVWQWWIIGVGLLITPVAIAFLHAGSQMRERQGLFPATAVHAARTAPVPALAALTLAGLTAATTISFYLAWDWFLFAAATAVAVTLLTFLIVANVNWDILVIAVVVAFTWSLFPRDFDPAGLDLRSDGPTIVAIGDSYISGEGAPAFIRGTNNDSDLAQSRNECRRAPTSYPVLVASGSAGLAPHRLIFVACSGARTPNIGDYNQYAGEGLPTSLRSVDGRNERLGPAQVTLAVNLGAAEDTRIVLVSIGGNDIGFSAIGQACIGPTDCASDSHQEIFDAMLAGLPQQLDRAYTAIRSGLVAGRADPPRVLVVEYPTPVSETTCVQSPLNSGEHLVLTRLVHDINLLVRNAAKKHGFEVVRAEDAFHAGDFDERICGPTSWRHVGRAENLFALNPKSTALAQVALPTNLFHNSVHPTPLGHRLIADRVVEQILCGRPDDAKSPTAPVCPVISGAGAATGRTATDDTAELVALNERLSGAAVRAGCTDLTACSERLSALATPRYRQLLLGLFLAGGIAMLAAFVVSFRALPWVGSLLRDLAEAVLRPLKR